MSTIRCPICGSTLAADGETMLSHRLRDHMASAHEIKDLCETGTYPHRGTDEPSSGGRPEEWERLKASAPSRQEVGEDVEQGVSCPLCGSRVTAHDADMLSTTLQDHIEDVHDLRPVRSAARLRL